MARTEFCDVGGHCQEIYQALIGSKLSSIVLINQISCYIFTLCFTQSHWSQFLCFEYFCYQQFILASLKIIKDKDQFFFSAFYNVEKTASPSKKFPLTVFLRSSRIWMTIETQHCYFFGHIRDKNRSYPCYQQSTKYSSKYTSVGWEWQQQNAKKLFSFLIWKFSACI